MSDRFLSPPLEHTAPQTALEKLFAFYQQELSKKYEAVNQSLQAFNQSLIEAGQDNEAVVAYQNEVQTWYTNIEKQLTNLNAQGVKHVANLQTCQDELQTIINQYELLTKQYPYLTAQDTSTLPKPLQDIRTHGTEIDNLKKGLHIIKTNVDAFNQTVTTLTTQLQALQSASEEKIRHARATLRQKLERLKTYYNTLASVPKKTTNEKYHDVYNYLRIAIETCPAEAFDSELVSVIRDTITTILRCIEAAIRREKKGIFGKNAHWLEYHYKHPARAISTLGLVAQEKSNQFNPSQSR